MRINHGKVTNNQCTIATYHEYDIIVPQECNENGSKTATISMIKISCDSKLKRIISLDSYTSTFIAANWYYVYTTILSTVDRVFRGVCCAI